MKYQVCVYNNGNWRMGNKYDTIDMAQWEIEHCIVNHNACVIDTDTGEIVYGL